MNQSTIGIIECFISFNISSLCITLIFISRKTKIYSLYGILDLSKTTTEKDYCTVQCEFSYDKSKRQPFVLEEAVIEML
ncbi:MAG: hypothetical protein K6E51_02840 [Treponema sp.]|nr:hypothetical protein [Treponema sp.]